MSLTHAYLATVSRIIDLHSVLEYSSGRRFKKYSCTCAHPQNSMLLQFITATQRTSAVLQRIPQVKGSLS